MSSNKRSRLRTLLGCGCSKPKPGNNVYQPKPKPKISIYQNADHTSRGSSPASVDDAEDLTSTTTITEPDSTQDNYNKNSNNNSIPNLIGSIAVEKDSEDPYQDFRHSMFQMMLKKQIYSEAGLQELLQCFLQLNAPCHHQVIVEAFMEICYEVFPRKKLRTASDSAAAEPSCSNYHTIPNSKE